MGAGNVGTVIGDDVGIGVWILSPTPLGGFWFRILGGSPMPKYFLITPSIMCITRIFFFIVVIVKRNITSIINSICAITWEVPNLEVVGKKGVGPQP